MKLTSLPRKARGFLNDPRKGYRVALHELGRRVNYGMNIYERDWDVLVILDACRYDLFEEFAPEHDVFDRFESVESVYSCASATTEWLPKTFGEGPDDLVADTHYVSCTGFSAEMDQSRLAAVDEVWRYAVDPEYGCTRPEAVTDAAIEAYRDHDPEKLVVHYTQPHAPFLHCAGKYGSIGNGGEGGTQRVWHGLQTGEFDHDEVWADYGQNLLGVLDEVETLLDNLSGDVVVTSDHGNAMGEWGLYGHPEYVPVPIIKRVPWVTATAEDTGEYEVLGEDALSTGLGEHDLRDNLKALGYVG